MDRRAVILFSLGLIVAACTAGGGASPSASDGRPSVSPIPSSPPPSGGILPEALAAAITADAATILGVQAADVRIVSAEPTTWNDGSLGCPKIGVMYVQVLIDGYKVIVEAGDRQLDYRTGRDGEFRICEGFKPGG